jgi:hypothetical protein
MNSASAVGLFSRIFTGEGTIVLVYMGWAAIVRAEQRAKRLEQRP